jgi:hypothetical protein
VVTTCLDYQTELSVWITSINIFEIRRGIEILSDGRRRSRLEA